MQRLCVAIIAAEMADIEHQLLQTINADGEVQDSGRLAASIGADHNAFVGTMKSLLAAEMIVCQDIDHFRHVLTEEATGYLDQGSPEAQVFHAVPAEGMPLSVLKAKVPGDLGDLGFKQAMQQKWLMLDKSQGQPVIMRKVRHHRLNVAL